MNVNNVSGEAIDELYKLLASLNSPEDFRALFNDLCTRKEIEKMAQRIKAARLLLNGETYQQVIDKTDISSATLSRVSQCVQYGKGYSRFLNKKL